MVHYSFKDSVSLIAKFKLLPESVNSWHNQCSVMFQKETSSCVLRCCCCYPQWKNRVLKPLLKWLFQKLEEPTIPRPLSSNWVACLSPLFFYIMKKMAVHQTSDMEDTSHSTVSSPEMQAHSWYTWPVFFPGISPWLAGIWQIFLSWVWLVTTLRPLSERKLYWPPRYTMKINLHKELFKKYMNGESQC